MKFRSSIMALVSLVALVVTGAANAQTGYNSITLSWTAPGDDGSIGTAAQFDLRYSTSPITAANFESVPRWTLTPAPAPAGTKQSVTVLNLQPATAYYFAIKTSDESQNWSPISNLATATTGIAPDATRPAPLAINVTSVTDTTATLGWTAVGDDSLTGVAASYDVRFSTSPITTANWAGATQATGEPTPGSAGTTQSITVRNLNRQQTYYFAARVQDESGNISAISNVPNVTTPDTMAPASIRDLAVGWLFMGWHAAAAAMTRGTLGR